MNRPQRIISIAVSASEYDHLLELAELAGVQTAQAFVADQIARVIAASVFTTDPVGQRVIEGLDDGAISRDLGMTRAQVANRRRLLGLRPNRPQMRTGRAG